MMATRMKRRPQRTRQQQLQRESSSWRWACILGMALLLPIGLPAGGARPEPSRPRQRQPGEPLLASTLVRLRREPRISAPQQPTLPIGQPLRAQGRWHDGNRLWLRVASGQRGRGWVQTG